MKHKVFFLAMTLSAFPVIADTKNTKELQKEVQRLQQQAQELQVKLNSLQKELVKQPKHQTSKKDAPKKPAVAKASPSMKTSTTKKSPAMVAHSAPVTVRLVDNDAESLEFYPTALIADGHVLTYIAGTPIVTSPYLGSRPAFDGSDYIVNISSINRDIRLMQQRRRLYRAHETLGYPAPDMPILAVSGKIEPIATIGDPFVRSTGDLSLGSSELDIAAILNKYVEGYMSLAYDASPPDVGGQRLSNSAVNLNMGFVNIGNLDKTPFYFTGGQIFVPFGRFSSSMVSAPLTMVMARTNARPFILGYKSRTDSGPFAAVYGYRSDTQLGSASAGGVNLGYIIDTHSMSLEIGGSVISSMNDAGGMQFTGSVPNPTFGTFGGFSSITNGNEAVKKIPAAGVHANLSIDRYNFIAEWVGATEQFRTQDLSFNGVGAKPQAGQLEAGVTFKAFDKPASFALGYQWSKQALALNLPSQRIAGVFNISIWKDTVESLEYRHDINYNQYQYANGAAPQGLTNANTIGSGGSNDTLLAQIGVYF